MKIAAVTRSICLLIVAMAFPAFAADPIPGTVPSKFVDALKGLKTANADQRQAVYDLISKEGDARLAPALAAYRDGTLMLHASATGNELAIYGARVDVPGRGSMLPLVNATTQQPIDGTDGQPILVTKIDLSDAMRAPPYREKRKIGDMLSALALNDPDPAIKHAAIRDAGDRPDDSLLPALQTLLAANPTGPFSRDLKEAVARLQLSSGTRDQKLAAVSVLGDMKTQRSLSSLDKALKKADDANDKPLVDAINIAIAAGRSYQMRIGLIQDTFFGLSLGSILVLLALGLSIIFGLMGVINMAHGEFMMVGAFTTFVVSQFFHNHFPSFYDWYLVAAIPAAFIVAGLAGYICEAIVIRHLYGRPLETLLATWGIGLILIQTARLLYGDNLTVKPPSWVEGGVEVMPDLTFPLNRLYILLFCGLCITGVYFIVNRTKLGLLLRATTQNREMAAALGVTTRRVDALTFAFGTGLAGLAGVAVPLYNKINPAMGQEYIVDSFMVVVVGGVGKLAGAIIAGLSLGFLNKYLEPLFGAIPALSSGASVLGKVVVLILIVIFLNFRPAGLFPPKGRNSDA